MVDQVVAAEVGQVRALGLVGQGGAEALGHGEHQGAVAHVEPERTAHQLGLGIAGEGIVGVGAELSGAAAIAAIQAGKLDLPKDSTACAVICGVGDDGVGG